MSETEPDEMNNTESGEKEGIVEIENLRKEYPGIVATDDVTLSINEGEFFTILGPSGSGKSTLLRLITGIEEPTSGEIYIAGKQVDDVKAYNRNTSLVFQEYALFPHLTARENVEYGLMLRGVNKEERRRRSQEMFEMMELTEEEDSQVTELSGGERQRVATARSLVIEPDVLLLDEVLKSLDERLAKEMQVELKRLQEKIEKTFVFVTHSQEEAFAMSDRLAIMDQGNVVQVGSPLEVYQNPTNEFIAGFLGMSNIFAGTVTAINDDQLTIQSSGFEFTVAQGDAEHVTGGDEIGFFVADEKMNIDSGYENELSGTIRDTILRGPYTEYAVQVDELDTEIRIHGSTGETLYDEGERVTVGFSPSDATLFD